MNRIGIYVRESRDDGFENYETIEVQKELLIEFVKKNELGLIEQIYIDDNISGTTFERPGLNLLKDDVINKRIDLLIIKDLSRLGRNNARTLMFLDFLEENNVRVLTYEYRFDSDKDSDIVGIEAWFNERYVKDISKKIRQTLHYKISMGEYIGNAPYGYRKSGEIRNRLTVNENEAEIIKRIVKLYLEGFGYGAIASVMTREEIPPPGGSNKKWSPTTVMRILFNPVYRGNTVQGISEKISYKSKKTRLLPKEKWTITMNTHEAIIDNSAAKQIDNEHQKRSLKNINYKGSIHIFKNKIKCGDCGSSLFARKRSGKPMSYLCGSYMKSSSLCSSHKVTENLLLAEIISDLIEIINNCSTDKIISLLKEDNYNSGKRKSDEMKFRTLMAKKDEIMRQQETLYMDRLGNQISMDLFSRVDAGLNSQIKNIEKEISVLSAHMEITETGNEEKVIEAFFNEITISLENSLSGKHVFSGDDQDLMRLVVSSYVNMCRVYKKANSEVIEIMYNVN